MATDLANDIGSRIREAREGQGLTAEKMAPLVGVTMGTLLRYERGETGKKGIGFSRLAKIAEVTGKPLSWFLSENGARVA